MPTLEYRGDYGSSVTLASARSASVAINGTAPDYAILPTNVYARIYVSTTARPYTYQYHVDIGYGYYGDLSYNFSANDTPVYVDVPINMTSLDAGFPIKSLSQITVSETGGHGSNTRIRGLVRIFVDYVVVGSATPPTNIRINGETAINLEAGTEATLTWSAGHPGAYDTFGTYRVRRYNVEDGTSTVDGYTTGLTYTITAPYTDSKSYYYYVDIINVYNNASSSTFASIFTFIQLTAPVVLGGGANPVYNPRPMFLVTLGDGPLEEYLTLVADGWTPSRKGYPGDKIYLRKNAGYNGAASDSVTITETDERMRSVNAALSVSYSPPVYTTPEIIAGTTIVNAADITELQDILTDIRTAYGMEAFTFTPAISGVTSLTLWPTHIAEIQNCITEIRDFVNAWDMASPTYAIILPTMRVTAGPSADVMNQLRQIVTLL